MAEDAQITCLCGAIREDGSLLTTPLPIKGGVDHCVDCRYTTGVLFHTAASLRQQPSAKSVDSCTVYASSSKLWRYFCSTCGTPCFLRNMQKDRWSIGTALIEPKPGAQGKWPSDVFIPTHHYFVGDSVDYKMASRLLDIDSKEVAIWDGDDIGPSVPRDETLRISGKTSAPSANNDRLEARCHCGKVDLRVVRPNWEQEIPGVVPPEPFKHKYRASFCVCRFCRLSVGGASFAPWMYVPPSNITTADGRKLEFSARGTNLLELLDYISTPNQNVRSSCKNCGARVFGWSNERPGIAVLAMGILRTSEGSAAGNWVWWRNEMSFEDEHMDHEMWKALTDDQALQRTQ